MDEIVKLRQEGEKGPVSRVERTSLSASLLRGLLPSRGTHIKLDLRSCKCRDPVTSIVHKKDGGRGMFVCIEAS